MTFAEKSAWIMGLALMVGGAAYVRVVAASSARLGEVAPPSFGLLVMATVALVGVAVVSHTVVALANPADANQPEDERDVRVAQRAGNVAGYVLGAAVLSGMFGYTIHGNGNLLFHVLVVGLILSQVSEYGLSLWFYRRGV